MHRDTEELPEDGLVIVPDDIADDADQSRVDRAWEILAGLPYTASGRYVFYHVWDALKTYNIIE